jgi:phage repressor protein C with HTH and peptisase S24 domain
MGSGTVGDRIKELRRLKGLTQQKLAGLAGLSQVTISDIERGRNKGSREIVRIAEALGASPTFLSTGRQRDNSGEKLSESVAITTTPTQSIRIAIYEGGGGGMDDSIQGVEASRRWVASNLPEVRNPSAVRIFECQDDSMRGTFTRGDILFVDTSVNSVNADGVYALTIQNDFFVKRVQRLPGGAIKLISDNAQHYEPHVLTSAERQRMRVRGRVLLAWNARRM